MAKHTNQDLVMGEDFFLYLTTDKKVVAYATSCELSIEGETIDVSSKFSCRWAASMRGNNSYTISSDSLYSKATGDFSYDNLMELMIAGEAIDWYMGQPADEPETACEDRTFALDTTQKHYGGKAIITSLSLSASNGEIASCSLTLTGVGEIETLPKA